MSGSNPDIVESCSLNVLVPETFNFDPASFFVANGSQGHGDDNQLSISAVPRRKVLYFGMIRGSELIDQSSYSFLGFY